jgi:hypothetical protein
MLVGKCDGCGQEKPLSMDKVGLIALCDDCANGIFFGFDEEEDFWKS